MQNGLIQHNSEQIAKKEITQKQEKEEDKKMVQAIVEREHLLDKIELEMKVI